MDRMSAWDAGRRGRLTVPADEVDALAKALDPRGLVLWVGGVRSPEHADAIAQRIARE